MSINFDIMSHWALLHNCNMISSPPAPNNTIINAFCCKLHKHTRFVYIGGECVEALALTSFSIRLCYTIVICSGTPSPRASLQAAPLPQGPQRASAHAYGSHVCPWVSRLHLSLPGEAWQHCPSSQNSHLGAQQTPWTLGAEACQHTSCMLCRVPDMSMAL